MFPSQLPGSFAQLFLVQYVEVRDGRSSQYRNTKWTNLQYLRTSRDHFGKIVTSPQYVRLSSLARAVLRIMMRKLEIVHRSEIVMEASVQRQIHLRRELQFVYLSRFPTEEHRKLRSSVRFVARTTWTA